MSSFKQKSQALIRVEITKLPFTVSTFRCQEATSGTTPYLKQWGACLCMVGTPMSSQVREHGPNSLSTRWPQMCPWVSRALVLVSSIKDSADLKIRLGVLGDNVVFLKVREGRVPSGP